MRGAHIVLGALLLAMLDSCTQPTRLNVLPATSLSVPASMHLSSSFTPLAADDPLRGDTLPVHDPSLSRISDGSWIAYTTDLPFLHSIPSLLQRCSPNLTDWHDCGAVFPTLPGWIAAQYPAAVGLWAPDISFFGGLYRMYYAVSSLGSQHSAIGMATNATLDPSDPRYGWQDQGPVLASEPGNDFNAIDPNIMLEPASGGGPPHVWLNYGSFWGGLYQQELDPGTGKLLAGGTRYHLAQQPASLNGAIEGAAMAAHNGWFYLFSSVGICCTIPIEGDNYQQIVGRSRSIHGPFVAEDGGRMLDGGGTVLLTGDANWLAPGGGSLWQSVDQSQTLLAFHALRRAQNGALYLWIEKVAWKDDWPVLGSL